MENENPHRPEEPIIIPERIDKPNFEWPGPFINVGESIKTVITEPLTCLETISERKNPKNHKLERQFIGGMFLAVWLLTVLSIPFKIQEEIDGEEFFILLLLGFLMALMCLGYLLFISLFTFLLKSIKGKAKFGDELLTAALSSIPLGVSLLYLFIFISEDDIYLMAMMFWGINQLEILLLFVFGFVSVSLATSIIQQSLSKGGFSKVAGWYLSPLVFGAAMLLTLKVGEVMVSLLSNGY